MTISFLRPKTNVYPETTLKSGIPSYVQPVGKLLSPALARHSSWPEMESGYKRNWQFEMAEQHRRNSQVIDRSAHLAHHSVVGLQRSHTFDASQCYTEEDYDYEDSQSQWTASSPLSDSEMPHCEWGDSDFENHEPTSFERGAFTPVFEDESPALVSGGHDYLSSPVGPTTPFGDFIDRAVTVADSFSDYNGSAGLQPRDHAAYTQAVYQSKADVYESPAAQPQDVPAPPSASVEYKKMAAPMSQFIADYVWKACTTGMSLPTVYSHASNVSGRYSKSPPSYLAPAIHNMLLSTLLQPSAIVLAIWYVVRLPVCFDSIALDVEHIRESNFRAELFGHGEEQLQATAPFRLVILGCMLSNKWLDDHTFSNKTWQSISNIPITALNKLEALALDIFSYDLSAPIDQWSQWLGHLIAYHQSVYCPAAFGIEPISRPSAHHFVRKMFDEISASTIELSRVVSLPQPVFVPSEQSKKNAISGHKTSRGEEQQAIEIDLDEDGPLREEYLPRRRTSGGGHDLPRSRLSSEFGRDAMIPIVLPPPADWVPAADEPIIRGDAQMYRRAMYTQPFVAPANAQWYAGWPTQCGYPTDKAVYSMSCYDPHGARDQVSHSRSQSEYEPCHSRYARENAAYQGRENYDSRPVWVAQHYGAQQTTRVPFGAPPQINFASSWLRA